MRLSRRLKRAFTDNEPMDYIRASGGSLSVNFAKAIHPGVAKVGLYGLITVVPSGDHFDLMEYRDIASMARDKDGARGTGSIIAQFASEAEAQAAHGVLACAMLNAVIAQESPVRRGVRRVFKLGTLAAALIAGALATGFAVQLFMTTAGFRPAVPQLPKLPQLAQPALPGLAGMMAQMPTGAPTVLDNKDDLIPSAFVRLPENPAESLKNAISFGNLNASPDKTFYVFSDPQCPVCKRFEKELMALPKDYLVHVFPVAYQPGSDRVVSDIMCSKNPQQAWRDHLVDQTGTPLPACDKSGIGAANLAQFKELGFTGTPSIVSTSINGMGGVYRGFRSAKQLVTIAELMHDSRTAALPDQLGNGKSKDAPARPAK